MFRRLRVLAAFFMVPIVVFATPNTAAAATTEIVEFNLSDFFDENIPGQEVFCKVGTVVQEVTGGSNVIVSPTSYCQGGVNLSMWTCQIAELDCGTYVLSYNSSIGECATATLIQGGDGGSNYSAQVGLSGQVQLGTCDPAEVCLTWTMGSDTRRDCVPSTLDPPLPPEVPCVVAGQAVVTPQVKVRKVIQEGTNYRWRIEVWGGAPAPTTGTLYWEYYAVLAPGGSLGSGGSTRTIQGGESRGIGYYDVVRPAGTPAAFTYVVTSGLMGQQAAIDQLATIQIVGHGLYASTGSTGMRGPSLEVPRTLPSVAFQTGRMGITDAASCSFYWGDKIADLSVVSTKDEPIGPVLTGPDDTAPPPIGPAVDPTPVEDPPEDEPSFWLSILGVLKSILSAIGKVGSLLASLAGKIVDGITGAFEGLFVPDDGYLESRYTSIENKWADTSPAKYADAVADFSVGSASGCEGMPLVLTLPGDVQVDQHIGAACSGPLASTASIVRTVLSAVFVVGGLMACVRAVGSGLGWDPGVGRGAGA